MYLRSTLGVLLLLALTLVPLPTWAQDSEDEEVVSGFGHLFVELSTWIAQPAGLGYSPATRQDPNNAFGTTVLSPDIGTKSEQYTKIGYVMPGEMGSFVFSFYDHGVGDTRLTEHNPGNFIYGETLAHPLFAGFRYDGKADFFDSTNVTQVTDFRLDFVRNAFERPKVKADWFVGARRVKHNRSQTATYNALIPGLPAFLPPLGGPFPHLDPLADSASVTSSFSGRGLEAGMNFKIPLLKNKLSLDAGFSVGLIRGDIDAEYRSQTRYYVLNIEGAETLLFPPFPELTQTRPDPSQVGAVIPLAADTQQRTLQVGLAPSGVSTSSDVIETHVGIRWSAWKDFTLSFGFRSARYSNVGLDLRPEISVIPTTLRVVDGEIQGVNLQNFTETRRDATYEGIYIGVGYKY